MGGLKTAGAAGESAKAELDSVLGSAVFARSPRLARLLSYLCTKYFEGEIDQIKEYNIAIEVLDRPESFDPAQDAIARVEVHRLRKKLREYYGTDGSDHALRIVIPTGRYAPVFVPAPAAAGGEAPAPSQPESAQHTGDTHSPVVAYSLWKRFSPWAVSAGVVAMVVLALLLRAHPIVASHPESSVSTTSDEVSAALLGAPPGDAVRILCGRRKPYTDRLGRSWGADQYFEGGTYLETSTAYLSRTFDPALFQAARSGDFSYHIPLKPGVYELHLYFAETTFGPGTGGGENNRVFHVAVNGRRYLSDFDIVSDAGGSGIADERVFKDVSPGSDGMLHVRFMSVRSHAVVSAIVVEPAWPHRLNPVRIFAQENSYTDAAKRIWMPDNFWSGGLAAPAAAIVEGTKDRELYAKERYGNFSYAIPADAGKYTVTLHFVENYWGRENPGGGGLGSREFDVFCNGIALLRDFDIYKEAGGGHVLLKTFHGLKPNAQGKFVLSFVPVRNYATVDAIEVADESRE